MKLELRHLAPYLPYGLKMQYTGVGKPFRGTKKQEELTIQNIELLMFSAQRKPILRPLSDLVKEIDGVVPFEEIAKIEAPNIVGSQDRLTNIFTFKRGVSFSSTKIGVCYTYEEGLQVEITHFKDAIFHKKVVSGNNSWVFSYLHNYPAILELLYRYHFDVFGLIPDGLAISYKEAGL